VRFLADGPFLPDELLVARDDGRVLFFCGAGVSRAKAELPGFLGLAERVLKELRALSDSAAGELVDFATRLQKEPIEGVGGILAADRIFGLLERDFALADIERAVGRALRPQPGTNLQAHRTLLELSRGPDGQVRLVTTNFDLLFEAAAPKVRRWTPSELPDLRRPERFHGIVHLHGMFDDAYSRPLGGNLVLSSAEFGRVYLAEGWATSFIRAAIARYLIVFVGYAADDPPVQYLLEALSRVAEQPLRGLYAFQEGRDDEAKALWKQKGVTAIAYTRGNNHAALWRTLTAWSERARDPEGWRGQLMRHALRGPEALLPHERGQVVHLAATPDGARGLAGAKTPIPATWLCVFDPAIRYETPGIADLFKPGSLAIDPFTQYRLDSDPDPPKQKENESFKRREVPGNVIDVLAPQPLDGPATNMAGIRGDSVAPLPPRLVSLAVWFMRVCGQPAALWWASGQKELHPVVLRNVQFELNNRESTLSQLAHTAWRYLFEAWRGPGLPDFMNAYAVKERLAREGWTSSARREFAELLRPVLTVARPYGVKPPNHKADLRLNEIVGLDVEYSHEEIPIEIPDSELPSVLPLLRRNLEEASTLESEVNPFGLSNIPPIEPDLSLPGESSDRSFGSNQHILKFAVLFKRLVALDCALALRELTAWRQDDDPIFARLRIWAAGIPGLLDARQAGNILKTVSDRVFWGDRDQRDLLLVLARRWSELPPATRKALERRLRRGLPRKRDYDLDSYSKLRVHLIMERLVWLQTQGCTFSFDVNAEIEALRTAIPAELMREMGTHAVDSREGRGGFVRTDTSFTEQLTNVPIDKLIQTALSAYDRRHGFFEVRDPYGGLCEKRPVRVLAALMRATEPSDDIRTAWTQFLHARARSTDKPALATLIARRLAQVPESVLANIILPSTSWFETAAKRIYETDSAAAGALFDRLLETLAEHSGSSAKKSNGEEPDWINSAWGSAAGHLTSVLLAELSLNGIPLGASLPAVWKSRANSLLTLPGDQGRFCLVQLARHLDWFFARDSAWTDAKILSAIDTGGLERDAALAGFFSNASIRGQALLNRMKPIMLALSTTREDRSRRDYHQILASLCIIAWQQKNDTGERWLSDEELRTALVYCSIDMRTHILWQVQQWKDIGEKLVLLREVWPLQLAARSPAVTERLCTIAFNDEPNFPALVEAILPLISPNDGGRLMLPLARDNQDKIFERYPEHVLALLSVVLPVEASKWPYGIDAALLHLSKTSKRINKDPRMIELRRRLTLSR
jgi:hypothetical protein